jgi:SpoVK/Ycf46/Vps4 family AAA+-type ATPase
MKRNLYLTLIPRFVETSLLLSEKQANSHVISYNRVVLLHGPPGTGKTSLCQVGLEK